MTVHNWQAYLTGYLVLTISGDDPEAFLNLALARGLTLLDVTRTGKGQILVKMPVSEYRLLRPLARESHCRVRIVDKRGLPFFSRRLRGRQLLLVGVLFFLVAIYILSACVWVVDVRPEKGTLRQVTPDQVIAAARAEGLKPGAWKGRIDIRALEYGLEQRLPQLAWVGVSFHGTRAEIKVVEKIPPPAGDDYELPASIIAAKDGVIKQILVMNGEGRVAVGDTVRRGEVLISGLILPPEPEKKPGENQPQQQPRPEPRLVRARGIVRARVWYEEEKEIERLQVREQATGRQQRAIIIKTPGRQVVLRGPARSPYAHYLQENKVITLPSWRNFPPPVELIISTYREIRIQKQQLGYEEAVRVAGQQALASLKARLPAGVTITGEKIIPLTGTGEQRVRVRAWVETEEDIGQVVPLHGRTPPGGNPPATPG
ncbi:sporulation protein YqfD [Neomoorella thermoacetica]|uniref:sporulation protein YqfD n=1 Tax=Neomoorella thermoacetica TaxID=1525 RepID=UPI0008FA5B3F|nr:sporulation protein YqfD [Moorella thermoacetica]OIQ12037.1 putative stage IV sporulation protein YqfD [Moorella thermoacetica]